MLVRLNHTIGFTSCDSKPSFDWAAPISLVHRSSSISYTILLRSRDRKINGVIQFLLVICLLDWFNKNSRSCSHFPSACDPMQHPLVINQYPAQTRNDRDSHFFTRSTFLLLLQVPIYHALPKLIWSQALQLTVIVFSSNLTHASSV